MESFSFSSSRDTSPTITRSIIRSLVVIRSAAAITERGACGCTGGGSTEIAGGGETASPVPGTGAPNKERTERRASTAIKFAPRKKSFAIPRAKPRTVSGMSTSANAASRGTERESKETRTAISSAPAAAYDGIFFVKSEIAARASFTEIEATARAALAANDAARAMNPCSVAAYAPNTNADDTASAATLCISSGVMSAVAFEKSGTSGLSLPIIGEIIFLPRFGVSEKSSLPYKSSDSKDPLRSDTEDGTETFFACTTFGAPYKKSATRDDPVAERFISRCLKIESRLINHALPTIFASSFPPRASCPT